MTDVLEPPTYRVRLFNLREFDRILEAHNWPRQVYVSRDVFRFLTTLNCITKVLEDREEALIYMRTVIRVQPQDRDVSEPVDITADLAGYEV